MKNSIIAAATCALLSGCGTYSETGLVSSLDDAFIGDLGISRSGVTDMPLAADAYRIRGYGNQNASFEKTNALAMVRAATLASSHGYARFQILDYATWEKTTYHSTPATAHTTTTLRANSYGGYTSGTATSNTAITPGVTYGVDRPRTDLVVKFVRSGSPDSASALRVVDIIARYGKKAGLSPEEVQNAMNIEEAPAVSSQPQQPVAAAATEAVSPLPPPSNRTHHAAGLTLDEVYKALTPAQRAQVDRLPPARRADYLTTIRDGAR